MTINRDHPLSSFIKTLNPAIETKLTTYNAQHAKLVGSTDQMPRSCDDACICMYFSKLCMYECMPCVYVYKVLYA